MYKYKKIVNGVKNYKIRHTVAAACILTVLVIFMYVCMPAAFEAGARVQQIADDAGYGPFSAVIKADAASSGTQAQGSAGFSDVPDGSWFRETVLYMSENGIINGYPDGTFRPNKTISAAEFVAVTARCAGLQASSNTQNSHWAAGLLQAALDAGWYDWDELPPTGETYDSPMTRQVAVSTLMRALLPDRTGDYSTESAKMTDFSSLNSRYYNKVFAAYACGVVTGDNAGRFMPQSSLTRAQACAIIERALKLSGIHPGGSGNANASNGSDNKGSSEPASPPEQSGGSVQQPQKTISGSVSKNGWLQVKGTQLCSESGSPVMLRGMSSHGIQWYTKYASAQSVANTASYGANVFRIAMYTAENGYISNTSKVTTAAFSAVDAALSNDMYAILDWHILSDGDPMTYKKQAEKFFAEASARYKDKPGVIYEICNEPNGNVSWSNNIKPYAQDIVNIIRKNSPKSIILIGSGTWSQDILDPAKDPVNGSNIMYTCHFYAGTHGEWLRQRITQARKLGAPIFISEWGTSAADGNGGVYLKQSAEWLDFLEKNGISWVNWSLCDKSESSAALRPGTSATAKWTQSDLTESGKFVFARFAGK